MKVDPNKKTNTANNINVEEIKREIEKKTDKRIDNAYKNGTLFPPKDLLTANEEKKTDTEDVLRSIMGSGAKEFNEKVGRPMTYSEMREMWG